MLRPYHAATLLKFSDFVHATSEDHCPKLIAPFCYHAFARFFNGIPAEEYKYHLAEYDARSKKWVLTTEWVIPSSIHTHFVDRQCYHKLITLGILNSHRDVEQHKLSLLQITLEHPFDDVYRHNIYFQCCNKEPAQADNYQSLFSYEQDYLTHDFEELFRVSQILPPHPDGHVPEPVLPLLPMVAPPPLPTTQPPPPMARPSNTNHVVSPSDIDNAMGTEHMSDDFLMDFMGL
ncbi:hypothetical protein C0995_013637 [Termitomyces sp. Mi166|nr:hypothetical protein C0995_013637 [Termitomyces sp. Mi166\